jgi:hypothetical protein
MDKAILHRMDAVDWDAAEGSLAGQGYALTGPLLEPGRCRELITCYGRDELFRSQVVMERHRFGKGDYKYFRYPLPDVIKDLRESSYIHLAGIANRWNAELAGSESAFPARHSEFLARCRLAGQQQPTPLLLHYETDGFNCLHQDLYGEVAFPLQLVIMLGQQDRDWEGGEFVLAENIPRAQSRVQVITADQGHGVIFTTGYRPVKGSRGYYRAAMRHGVSRVRRGTRYALGIIYHDAK